MSTSRQSESLNTGGPSGRGGGRERSIYLDALRAIALCRVVLYHATSIQWLTIFAAMPLMFFVAGSLFAGSLDHRERWTVIRSRYRRILFPYWLYIAAMIALWAWLGVLGEIQPANWVGIAFPVLSLNGPQGPGAGTTLELTWIALWYLQFHLILSLVGPWLRKAQVQRPKVLWGCLIGGFVVSLVAGLGLVVILYYMACWVLGYHHNDGHLKMLVQDRWAIICVVSGVPGAALFMMYQDPEVLTGIPLRIAVLGAALLGIFWLTLAMGLQSRIEPLLNGAATRAVIYWFSQRSLTIYMWHMVAIYVALELVLPGVDYPLGRVAWCMAGTVVAVVATGWAEDLAARRGWRAWPVPPKVLPG